MEERMKDDEIEIDLGELFHLLLRKIWIIIACFVAGAVLFGGFTKLFITPQYEASSMIYILGKTTSISSAMDLQLSQQLTVDFETLAKSRPVINRVIKELDLDATYEEMIKTITVENPADTSILKMVATNPDPKLAKDIANELADATARQVASVMVTDKPSTVEEAVTPKNPSSPNTLKNTAIGGILLAFLAAAIIVIMHLMDDTIKTEEDVRKYLNLNTLAAVPMEQGERQMKRKKKKVRAA